MQVSREMIHEDLKRYYTPAKWIAWALSKRGIVKLINRLETRLIGKNIKGLQCEEIYIPSLSGGPEIRVRVFRPLNHSGRLPGFLYLHGGGYMIGNPEIYLDKIKMFIDAKACVVVAPDYRKALSAPYPAAFNDGYDTLLWMKENADKLRILPKKFVVGGHSAGGGLAAAISLKARETREVEVAFQLPIYPMIDDRQDTDSARDSDAPAWNTASNRLGWREYLKDLKGNETPPYAAAARETDYAGLPPTISFVGEMEPFRDETLQYIENLRSAGVPVRFELFDGCFHGFEIIAPDAGVGKSAWDFVLGSFRQYTETYF